MHANSTLGEVGGLHLELSIKLSAYNMYGKINLISTTSGKDTLVCSPLWTRSFPCWLQSIVTVPDDSIQMIQKTPSGIHHIYFDTSHMRLAARIPIRHLAINRRWVNRLTELGGSEAFNCSENNNKKNKSSLTLCVLLYSAQLIVRHSCCGVSILIFL